MAGSTNVTTFTRLLTADKCTHIFIKNSVVKGSQNYIICGVNRPTKIAVSVNCELILNLFGLNGCWVLTKLINLIRPIRINF